MNLSMKHGIAAGLTACAMAWGVQAQAATVNLTFVGPSFGSNFVDTRVRVNNSSFSTIPTGAFSMSMGTSTPNTAANAAAVTAQFGVARNFLAWCVELTQSLNTPRDYSVSWANNQSNRSWHGNVQTLISVAYQSVLTARSNVMSAAFQLALWELVTGTPDHSLSQNDGDGFRASSTLRDSSSLAAVSQAQTWLGQVRTGGPRISDYHIVLFQSSESQDLIALVPTPLPGAALLFASALGLGGLAHRARARRAAAAATA
jgi:hypothetical protein